jgi:O-antigen/teichoic acid export membrane protein
MLVNYTIFFFLTPLMLNKLGEEQYSIWLLLSNIILYFSLSNFGLFNAFSVELPKVKESKTDTDRLVNTVLFSLLGIGCLSSFFFILLEVSIHHFFKIHPDFLFITQLSLLFFFLTFLISLIGGMFDYILISTNHLVSKNLIEIAKVTCIGGASIVLVVMGKSIVYISVANFLFTFAFFFITFYTCKKVLKYKVNMHMFDLSLLKKLTSPSWHYFIMGIAGMLVFYSDNLLISKLKGVEFVGLYAVTYRLTDVCLKVISRLSATKYPKIITLASEKNYKGLLKLHNRLLMMNLAITLPICGIIFFFGKDILTLWLGNKYVYNVTILRTFAFFTLFMVCAQNTGTFIGGLGIHKRFAYMGLAEGAVNLILSYLLYQYFDLAGIALGTLFAHVLTNGWFGYFEFYRFILPKTIKERHASV